MPGKVGRHSHENRDLMPQQIFELTRGKLQTRSGKLQMILQRTTTATMLAESPKFEQKGFTDAMV